MVAMDERQRVLEAYGTAPGPEGCRLAAAVIVPTDLGPAVAFVAGECPPEPWASRITNPMAWCEPFPPHVVAALEDRDDVEVVPEDPDDVSARLAGVVERGVVSAPVAPWHPSGWMDAGHGRTDVQVRVVR